MTYRWWKQTKSGLVDAYLEPSPDRPSKRLSARVLADGATLPLADASKGVVRDVVSRDAITTDGFRGRRHRRDSQKQPAWFPMSAVAIANMVARFEPAEIDCRQEVRGVFADVAVGEYRLRSHALVWTEDTSLTPDPEGELSLLLVLDPIDNSYLPIGTELTIAENNLLHSGQALRWACNPTCLYTQVYGDWGKQFTVQVMLPNGASMTLPPLTFSQA